MKLEELRERLLKENIREDVYSLDGGLPCEAICILKSATEWEVYYSERGSKTSLTCFNNEEEACDYFYNWLIKILRRMGLL